MKKTYLVMLFAITLFSCIPPQLPLSNEERELEYQLSKDFGCAIEFKHDYPTIKKEANNGTFGISICDNLCDLDYSKLLQICKNISKQVAMILSHRNSYKSIYIGISRSEKLNEKAERGICLKSFEFLVSNPDSLVSYKKIY